MINKEHESLSVRNQCELLELNRSTLYYQPVEPDTDTLALMRLIDEIFINHPYFGARRIRQILRREHKMLVTRKRVRRLMRLMGLETIYRKPRTSDPAPEHKIYPYLLRDVQIERPDLGFRHHVPTNGKGIRLPGRSDGLAQSLHFVMAPVKFT